MAVDNEENVERKRANEGQQKLILLRLAHSTSFADLPPPPPPPLYTPITQAS